MFGKAIYDAEFLAWLEAQPVAIRRAILSAVVVVEEVGPAAGRPRVDTLRGSSLPNLKELRVQVGGKPYRVIFAFGPERRPVFLVGGDKSADKRWYDVNIPIAEARFAAHLAKPRP